MSQPKFIITTKGYFRLGMVHLHKDLLKPGDQCLGGGYYRFEFQPNRIVLEGASQDFGPPLWDVLQVLKMPSDYRGFQIVYRSYDSFIPEFNVSEELTIEYYT